MPSAKQEDVEKLAKEIDRVGQLAESAARLGLQTSHRYGVDNAKRSVVVFLRDEPKAELAEKWKVWQTNAQLPPEQRPTEKPPPRRHQVGQWLAQYITAGMAQSMDETVQGILQEIKILGASIDNCTHKDPPEGDDSVWPLVLLFKNSEIGDRVRENLLSPLLTCLGRTKPVGIRPARHLPTGPANKCMELLGIEPKGRSKGKRRSPKREPPHSSPTSGQTASRPRR